MFNPNNVNKTIRTLIISDFFLLFAYGLLAPIFAVFILEHIDNKIEVIGYAVSIYWLTRVVMVMPICMLMDRLKGDTDEFLFMIFGTLLIACLPLLYIFASAPWHIYLLQIGNGLAYSMAIPAWRILFTNNVDRGIVGFEWSLEDVSVGIATAVSAAAGAYVASRFGFNALFIMISIFGLISFTILLSLYSSERSFIKKLLQKPGNKAPLKIDTLK